MKVKVAVRADLATLRARINTHHQHLPFEEWTETQPVNSHFSLRAHAARISLQVLDNGRCCAAANPVIHASRRTNGAGKDQVADIMSLRCICANDGFFGTQVG